ncbi:Pycsar system effector family protein [Flagellimonas abyssi]|uniref:Pycsar effector protein domain-containing protein n=1 Tax=Flagellimonas abyssi TaxID=2864871 RepID=A0ABS7EY21_9FLAO|nr:Pycsar system effector family protein [Allomuricauda abyssi]MBW8201904.1 hypothetical protein [Allomuricauda abyssi]
MEKERLEFTINRLDHYYDSVNNKTAVYIALNTFITGGAITFMTQIQELMAKEPWLVVNLVVIITCGVISLVLLAMASMPYLSPSPIFGSLYYFGSIGQKQPEEYFEQSKKQGAKGDKRDLRNQVHILSQGLNAKFKKLKWACQLLLAQFALLAPLTFLLIKTTLTS